MKLTKKEQARILKTVKCNCGHYNKDHYNGGWCKKCGCTWYWPNDKYIIKYKKRKKEMNMTKEEFYDKWMSFSFSIGPMDKKEKKQFMKDLDDVIYTIAMEAIKKAEKKISNKARRAA